MSSQQLSRSLVAFCPPWSALLRAGVLHEEVHDFLLEAVSLRPREFALQPRRQVVLPPELPALLGHGAVATSALILIITATTLEPAVAESGQLPGAGSCRERAVAGSGQLLGADQMMTHGDDDDGDDDGGQGSPFLYIQTPDRPPQRLLLVIVIWVV